MGCSRWSWNLAFSDFLFQAVFAAEVERFTSAASNGGASSGGGHSSLPAEIGGVKVREALLFFSSVLFDFSFKRLFDSCWAFQVHQRSRRLGCGGGSACLWMLKSRVRFTLILLKLCFPFPFGTLSLDVGLFSLSSATGLVPHLASSIFLSCSSSS